MDSATKRLLEKDMREALTEYPGLSISYNQQHEPNALEGRLWLPDDPQRTFGQLDIEVHVPAAYPHGFPILRETSRLVPACGDRHMSPDRIACTELTYKANLRARRGLTITQFMSEYVVRYFTWQVLYEAGHHDRLKSWAHNDKGLREFFCEELGSKDTAFIRAALFAAAGKHKLSANDPCFCPSGKKYKHCHQQVMHGIVLAVGAAEIPKARKLFAQL